jgi:hypothetical protein
VRGGRPINETSYNAQRELAAEVFKIGQQACFDQASVCGQDRNAQGMTAYSVCILEFQQGWQPWGVRILNSRFGSTGPNLQALTKVDATGGLELKPRTWELLRASTAGTVEPIGHDECHRVAIYGRVETRLKLLATESEVKRWGGFF